MRTIEWVAPDTTPEPVVLRVATAGVYDNPVFELPAPDGLTVEQQQIIRFSFAADNPAARSTGGRAVLLIAQLLPGSTDTGEQARWLEGADRVANTEAEFWWGMLADVYGETTPKP